MPYRVIVAGDRHLTDYALVRAELGRLLAAWLPDVVVLSGGATGADTLGERWAEERGLAVERHLADWKRHGRAAGPIRNEEMARTADACVVFDGGGPGSASMMRLARQHNVLLFVVPLASKEDTP